MSEHTCKRGTTPTHTFTLPEDYAGVTFEKLCIVYKQGNELLFEKGADDVIINANTISLTLTEQETLMFKAGCSFPVLIEVIVKTNRDKTDRSEIFELKVSDTLKNEVV